MNLDPQKLQEAWSDAREEILEWKEKYRDRHSQWKAAYYSAILSVSGIYIGLSIVSETDGVAIATIRLIGLFFSTSSIVFVFINMKERIRTYDELGFEDVSEDIWEAQKQRKEKGNEKPDNQKRGDFSRIRDFGSEVSFAIASGCFLLSYAVQYVSLLCENQ